MTSLKNFKIDKIIQNGGKHICIGTDSGQAALLEIFNLETKGSITDVPDKVICSNDIYQTGEMDMAYGFKFRYICPASELDVQRISKLNSLVNESYDEYLERSKAFSNSAQEFIKGLENLKHGEESNSNKVLYTDDEFVVLKNINLHETNVILYIKNSDYHSLRDINDIDQVIRAQNILIRLFEETAVERKYICIYIDLMPKDMIFCIKAKDISSGLNISFDGGVLLIDNFINNLKEDKDYYKKDHCFIIQNK